MHAWHVRVAREVRVPGYGQYWAVCIRALCTRSNAGYPIQRTYPGTGHAYTICFLLFPHSLLPGIIRIDTDINQASVSHKVVFVNSMNGVFSIARVDTSTTMERLYHITLRILARFSK